MAQPNGATAVDLTHQLVATIQELNYGVTRWVTRNDRRALADAIGAADTARRQLPEVRDALVELARDYDDTHTDHDPRD